MRDVAISFSSSDACALETRDDLAIRGLLLGEEEAEVAPSKPARTIKRTERSRVAAIKLVEFFLGRRRRRRRVWWRSRQTVAAVK